MRGPRTTMKSGPQLPQLEKALAQKRRPNTAKNKLINFKKKESDEIKIHVYMLLFRLFYEHIIRLLFILNIV